MPIVIQDMYFYFKVKNLLLLFLEWGGGGDTENSSDVTNRPTQMAENKVGCI